MPRTVSEERSQSFRHSEASNHCQSEFETRPFRLQNETRVAIFPFSREKGDGARYFYLFVRAGAEDPDAPPWDDRRLRGAQLFSLDRAVCH